MNVFQNLIGKRLAEAVSPETGDSRINRSCVNSGPETDEFVIKPTFAGDSTCWLYLKCKDGVIVSADLAKLREELSWMSR